MILRGIALYNGGNREESVRLFKQLESMYPNMTAAKKYLRLIKESPAEMVYSVGEPYINYLMKAAEVDVVFSFGKKQFSQRVLENDGELFTWAVKELAEEKAEELIGSLGKHFSEEYRPIFNRLLMDASLKTGVKHALLFNLLKHGGSCRCKLVVENVLKEIYFDDLDEKAKQLPHCFTEAYYISASDMVIVNFEPQVLLDCLQRTIKKVCARAEVIEFDGIRSSRTLAAVFSYLSESTTDYFDGDGFFEDYQVNKALFARYYKLCTGEDFNP